MDSGLRLLEGQVSVVSGGAAGIGLAIARRLAGAGARVVIADVRAEAVEEAVRAAATDGVTLEGMALDVTDAGRVEEALGAVAARLGPPTIAVANAGVFYAAGGVETPVERFRAVLEVNLTGAFVFAQATARLMLDAGLPGSVTFTGSVAGLRGLRGNAAYAASKAGLQGLSSVLATEWAERGIRVNVVCPGQIETPMLEEVVAARSGGRPAAAAAARDELLRPVPMARAGSVDEVADTFLYLASPLARYVTGQVIAVDGGWTA